MPVEAKIDVKNSGLIKDIQDFKEDLLKYIPFKATASVKDALPELKLTVMSVLTRMYNAKEPDTKTPQAVQPEVTFPKLKKDIVQEIFGKNLDSMNPKNTNTKQDDVNVFVVRGKRIKAWQSVSDGSTYEGDELKFKERLQKSVIINYDNGKMYVPDPETVKGVKIECSRDTGETINSSKKFDAYKNSQNITRTKSPYQRSAIWTVRQADTQNMLANAISLDALVEQIQNGNFQNAIEILNQKNKTGVFTEAIDNIKKTKKGKGTNVDLNSYYKLKKLVDNLNIKRYDGPNKTTISLVTSYDDSVEDQALDFFTELRKYIYLWMQTNMDRWVKDILTAIETVVKKYNRKG